MGSPVWWPQNERHLFMNATRPLFDANDDPIEREVMVPETFDALKTQFIHRWGYNRTAQEDMATELDELINRARRIASGEQA